MDQPKPSGRRAEAVLLGVVLIWALNGPIVKYGIGILDIFVFNAIRFTVAFVVLLVIFLFRNVWTPVSGYDWYLLIRLGILANVVYQLLYIFGLNFTTAGNSAVLLSTSPLWTAFFNARIHKERIYANQWFGMALSLVGIVMIIIGSGEKLEIGGRAVYGDLLSLGAAMMWALFTNHLKPLLLRYSPMQISVIGLGVGALGLDIVAIPAMASIRWNSVEPLFYVVPFVSGALSNGISTVLWSFGVRTIGPSLAANFNNLVPVIAFIAAYFMLHEQVFLVQVIGAAITVTGVWIARR